MSRDMTKWTDEMIAIAAGMKRAGLSNQVIADRFGVTAKAVANRLQRAGAKRRLDGHGGGLGPFNHRLRLDRAQHDFDKAED